MTRCTYQGMSGNIVSGGKPSPMEGCSEYALITMDDTIGQKQYTIACVACEAGLNTGDFFFNGMYVGSCYPDEEVGGLVDDVVECGEGMSRHGKSFTCEYRTGEKDNANPAVWAEVGMGAGTGTVTGCYEYKLCR